MPGKHIKQNGLLLKIEWISDVIFLKKVGGAVGVICFWHQNLLKLKNSKGTLVHNQLLYLEYLQVIN